LHALDNFEPVHSDYDGIFAYRKHAPGNELLVVVNLDPHAAHETMIDVPLAAMGIVEGEAYDATDLLTGTRYTWRGARNYVRLDPNERVAHLFRISRHV
jgi:starch synthase (maltosyl-transferring)